MKTILIPTDFSDSAVQAIRYAAALSDAIGTSKVILYNTYAVPPTTTTVSDVSFSFIETEGLRKMSEEQLAQNKNLLAGLLPGAVDIDIRSDYGFMEKQVGDVVKETGADLIVTGIEKMGALEEALTGNGAMEMLQHVQVPVLMVPPDAQWQPIRNIAWACDYKHLDKTPVWNLKPLLKATGATLHVIHNDPEHKQSDNTMSTEQKQIQEWFSDIPVTFSLLSEKELSEAVNHYVIENSIDLLIAIPKKHGWFEGLFTSSHSKQLAFSAHVPVVCVQGV